MSLDLLNSEIERSYDAPELLDGLRLLNLLPDDLETEADRLLEQLRRAEEIEREHATQRSAAARAVGASLAEADELDLSRVLAEVVKLGDPEDVKLACRGAWRYAFDKLWSLIGQAAEGLPTAINEQFTYLVERATELSETLANIPTADAALIAGKGDAWVEAGDHAATYRHLAAVAEQFRRNKLIAYPRTPGKFGPWWSFQTPGDRRSFSTGSQVDMRHRWMMEMITQNPWVPATEAEAEAAQPAWV